MTFSSGYVQEGVFHGGLLNGFGKEIDAKVGRHYEGSFKDGNLLLLCHNEKLNILFYNVRKMGRTRKGDICKFGDYFSRYLSARMERRWVILTVLYLTNLIVFF